MDGIAKTLESKAIRKYKPQVAVGVSVDTRDSLTPASPNRDWRKEEMERTKAEISAIEKEISGFDPKKAADRVKKALEARLKLKKIRLEEHELRLSGVNTDLY